MIPHLDDTIYEQMLMWRYWYDSADEDLEDLCSIEYVLDSFDNEDKLRLRDEIDDAKRTRSSLSEFMDDMFKWTADSI